MKFRIHSLKQNFTGNSMVIRKIDVYRLWKKFKIKMYHVTLRGRTLIFRFLWEVWQALSDYPVEKNFPISYKFSDLSRFPANGQKLSHFKVHGLFSMQNFFQHQKNHQVSFFTKINGFHRLSLHFHGQSSISCCVKE